MNSIGAATRSVVSGIFLVLVIAIGVCEWLGWPFLRQPIAHAIERRLQRDVSFSEDFRVSLFGALRLSADAFTIGPPRGERRKGAPDSFVQASDVELTLPYSTLLGALRGPGDGLRVRSLRVAQLDAQLWRGAQGPANWQLGAAADPDYEGAPIVLPEFDQLIVREGRLRFDDAVSRIHLTAAVSTNEGTASGGESAGLKIIADGTYDGQPVRVRVASNGLLPLAQSTNTTPPVPVSLQVTAGKSNFEFEGQAADVLHLHSLDGRFSASGLTLADAGETIGVTLPHTPAYTIEGRVRKDGVVWSADIGSFKIGQSSLSGEFEYDPQARTALLSGTLRGERLVLGDLAPAVGASPRKTARKDTSEARKTGANQNADTDTDSVLPQREFDVPSLRAMNASVAIDLKRLDLPTRALRPIAPLQARLTLSDGVLRIGTLVGRTAGGQLRGDLEFDAQKQPPLWSADLAWSGIDLAKWITLRNENATDGQAEYVTGALSGQAKLRGSGRSTAAILGSLDGRISTWIRDGSISHLVVEATGLDVAQGVGLLVVGDDPLPLHCAVAQLNATAGTAQMEVGILDTPDSTVFVTGSVSLAKETLALVLTAKPKDFSPLTLRAPVRIEGSFEHPQVHPEATTIGVKLAAAALLAAINPLAALIPLMDPADPAVRQCSDVLADARSPRTPGKAVPKPKRPAQPQAAPKASEPPLRKPMQ